MKHNSFYTDLIKVSEKIMNERCLVIGDERFEILSISIHCENLNNEEKYITDRQFRPGLFKWFISPYEYVRYIDIDLTSSKILGGLRIDSIRSINGQRKIVSCGKIFDFIKKAMKGKDPIVLNGKPVLKLDSFLFLEKYAFDKSVFYESPRVVGYNFQVPKGHDAQLYRKFLNLKVSKTNDIKSLIEMGDKYQLKINHIPLILSFYEKNEIENIQKSLHLSDSTLYKYIDLYTKSKNTTQWEILSQYQDIEKSNYKLIAALNGHFFKEK